MTLAAPRLRVGRNGLPEAPWEIRDEVELYARQSGRTGTIHFVPFGGWFVRFSLRSNDRRMLLFQQGMAAEPPTEDTYFNIAREHFDAKAHPIVPGHEPHPGDRRQFYPLDILQMGAGGVREFLEKGNTWSGRGVFKSQQDVERRAAEDNAEKKARLRRDKQADAVDRAMDGRRSRLKIPFLGAGKDLK